MFDDLFTAPMMPNAFDDYAMLNAPLDVSMLLMPPPRCLMLPRLFAAMI